MKYAHIESSKEHLELLNKVLGDNSVPFETRMELASIYGSFKVILETYEALWHDKYGSILNRVPSSETLPLDPIRPQ